MPPGPADRLLEAARRALDEGRPALAREALARVAQLDASDPRLAPLWARLPGPGGNSWSGEEAEHPETWWKGSDPEAATPTGAGLALLLAEADPPEASQADAAVGILLEKARACLARADFSGVLEGCAEVLEASPADREALQMKVEAEANLLHMLESRLGPLSGIPQVVMEPDEVVWLSLDHRAGFVLAQVDGTVTWEDLFALSGMDRLDTCRVLAQLLDEGVVAVAAAS